MELKKIFPFISAVEYSLKTKTNRLWLHRSAATTLITKNVVCEGIPAHLRVPAVGQEDVSVSRCMGRPANSSPSVRPAGQPIHARHLHRRQRRRASPQRARRLAGALRTRPAARHHRGLPARLLRRVHASRHLRLAAGAARDVLVRRRRRLETAVRLHHWTTQGRLRRGVAIRRITTTDEPLNRTSNLDPQRILDSNDKQTGIPIASRKQGRV